MTINGGASWAASSQSYGKGSVQGQSGASGKADYTSKMQEAANDLLSTLDTDKSGTIDKTEFSQAAQALAEKTGKSYNDAGSVFGSVDSNSDGAISADELMKALQQSQGKQAHDGHHHKPEALDTSSQSLSQTADTTQSTSEEASLSKMQMALLQRVMAAYSSNANATAASSSTTLATA